jgi:hypothetical protein
MGAFTQGLTQGRDALRKIVLLDHCVAPDSLHQFIFTQHLPAGLDEYQQSFEGPWA